MIVHKLRTVWSVNDGATGDQIGGLSSNFGSSSKPCICELRVSQESRACIIFGGNGTIYILCKDIGMGVEGGSENDNFSLLQVS